MPPKILVSAGEASGDLYASELVTALRESWPDAEFFGCAGPRMRAAGVRAVVDSANLAVVGLVEVLSHVPGIYREFRKLVSAAKRERPALAILTDSPDFHLRLAKKLKRLGIPVIYLIAPQVWAWRQGRVRQMRRNLNKLLCIFPFEKKFFETHGIPVEYLGHPLTRIVRPNTSKDAFFRKHGIDGSRPVITLLPGSRIGEVARHLPPLSLAAALLKQEHGATLILAVPAGFSDKAGLNFFGERISGAPIQIVEGQTWDAIAHADMVIAASGTVTIEAALLGAPMVTFYRVTPVSWLLGKLLLRVPFYSMVNLVAERRIVPELMQREATGENLAHAAGMLLTNPAARQAMQRDLAEVTAKLQTREDPMQRAAEVVGRILKKELKHGL
ncbi:MAG TPA: lipid-A-disaccharide synthase [Bryobacteraceae bacterium]|nr:lipid-A-disaccharide synthase [Bryobacteraceae bacterium]